MADGSRILIVEDDPALRARSYALSSANIGRSPCRFARRGLRGRHPIPLPRDPARPEASGRRRNRIDPAANRELRRLRSFLTARDDLADRVGLDAGADDYWKPFALEELLARLRAACRRPEQAVRPAPIESLGSPGSGTREVRWEAGRSHCPAGSSLCSSCSSAAPAGGPRGHLEPSSTARRGFGKCVGSLVSRLRRRLEEEDSGVELRTVRGVGYMLQHAETDAFARSPGVLTFTAVYIAAIAVFLTIIVVTDDPDRDGTATRPQNRTLARRGRSGADGNGFRLPRDGGSPHGLAEPGDLAHRPERRRHVSFGRVPEPVARAFEQRSLLVESGRFYVPGVERPLANAVVERHRLGSVTVLLAAGGVDPKTLGSGASLGASWGEGVLVILTGIAVVGFAAMLIALPILSRALRPLAAEAASILPQEPERRLDEDKAPRELLPLVRGFNAALDRLASELGRRKRFIADAAHELRTPLAVVALRVEALRTKVQAGASAGLGAWFTLSRRCSTSSGCPCPAGSARPSTLPPSPGTWFGP